MPSPSQAPAPTVATTDALSFAPEFTTLSSSPTTLDVLVRVTAPAQSDDAPRVPLRLVLVLDESGSMDGEKMILLREASQFLLTQLDGNDELAMVGFSDDSTTHAPLTKMTNAGKEVAGAAIARLAATAGTNIRAGLTTAADLLSRAAASQVTTAVLLLTDGLDSGGKADYSTVLSKFNGPVHAFGFGADHDARLLGEIASSTGGTFQYIESLQTIGDAFAVCLGTLKGAIFNDFVLDLVVPTPTLLVDVPPLGDGPVEADAGGSPGLLQSLSSFFGFGFGGSSGSAAATTASAPASASQPQGGARIERVSAGRYRSIIAPGGVSARLLFGNFSAGESRSATFRLRLGGISTAALKAERADLLSAPHWALSADASFTSPATGAAGSIPGTRLVLRRVAGAGEADELRARVPDVRVDSARARETASAAIKAALAAADKGRFEEVAAGLGAAIRAIEEGPAARGGDALAVGLVDDLRALASRLRSRADLNSGGRAACLSAVSSHDYQRAVCSPGSSSSAAYATPRQLMSLSLSPTRQHNNPRAACAPVPAAMGLEVDDDADPVCVALGVASAACDPTQSARRGGTANPPPTPFPTRPAGAPPRPPRGGMRGGKSGSDPNNGTA